MNREFLIDLRGNDAHILLAGEVDTLATAAVARAMDRAVRMPVRSIVMNLDNVTFIDSAGLGALAAGYHEAARCGLGYRIGPGAVPIVARILSVTRLGELTHEPTLGDETQASG